MTLSGALIGFLFGLGLTVAVFRSPLLRRRTLEARLEPYLRNSPRPSRLLAGLENKPAGFIPSVMRLASPFFRDLSTRLDRVCGGRASVQRRLDALGSPMSVEQFRLQQLTWGGMGSVGGAAVAIALSVLNGPIRVSIVVLLAIGGLICGILGRDWWLTVELKRRERLLLAEFPVVAELLALAVTAGESLVNALDRVGHLTGGEMGRDLTTALLQAKSGTGLIPSLEQLRDRTTLEVFARFLDGIIVALERGTPLSDVLRAQAADAGEVSKRSLMESGGRREIAMMFPVVFVILPVTVIFALFPGLITIFRLSH